MDSAEEWRGLWCDGFIPEQFESVDGRMAMSGRVWMGWGDGRQESWRFVLFVAAGLTEDRDVDWAGMLPGDDVTGWLWIDRPRRVMRIDPRAARADAMRGAG
ncbi:MAG TPA: hypothetical protein VH475_25985 [Tepidisphaeraceae bacterium]|jgi:hypothetical protein